MLNATGNPATFHSVIRYIQNGDALNTANFLTCAQDIADNLAWLKASADSLYSGAHTFTVLETFNAGITLGSGGQLTVNGPTVFSGSSASTAWRTHAVPNAATATLGVADGDIFYFTTLSQAIAITLKSTSPAAPEGAVMHFLKRGGGNFNVTFLTESAAVIGTNSSDNTQAFGISFAFANGAWRAFNWSGGGGVMGL